MRVVFIALVCLMTVSAFATERIYQNEFTVSSDATFSLESFKGTIKIRPHDKNAITVHAHIYPDDNTPEEAIEAVSIKPRNGDDFVSIEVDYPKAGGFLGGLFGTSFDLPFIDWDILVPKDGSLQLESHKSEFDVETPGGSVEIQTHKGKGSIRGVCGDFELETHKGEFEVEVLELSDLHVDTHKGDIEMDVHGATDFNLRGHSHKGSLSFTGYDIPIQKDDKELDVSFRTGSGTHDIELETHKGSITLNFIK